jgi:hypothetical protein
MACSSFDPPVTPVGSTLLPDGAEASPMDAQGAVVTEMDAMGAVLVWTTRRMAMLASLFVITLGIAVAAGWPVVQMVASIGLLLSFSVFIFRAIIDSLHIF